MADNEYDRHRRSGGIGEHSESGGGRFGLHRLVPSVVARAALTAELRAPETIRLGEPTTFYVVVRNRIPIPLSVSTPTSRLWGWAIDGVPEADRRAFSPPATGRIVRFGGLERKVFEATWDGRICEKRNEKTVWTDATGERTLTGYLAVAERSRDGLTAETTVTVIDGDDPPHQE